MLRFDTQKDARPRFTHVVEHFQDGFRFPPFLFVGTIVGRERACFALHIRMIRRKATDFIHVAIDVVFLQCPGYSKRTVLHISWVPFHIDGTASQILLEYPGETDEGLLGESNEEFDPFFLFSGKVDPDPARLHTIHQTTRNHLQNGVK